VLRAAGRFLRGAALVSCRAKGLKLLWVAWASLQGFNSMLMIVI
jgi:hypothetical protein